jgi:hypothetical protein
LKALTKKALLKQDCVKPSIPETKRFREKSNLGSCAVFCRVSRYGIFVKRIDYSSLFLFFSPIEVDISEAISFFPHSIVVNPNVHDQEKELNYE